MPYVLTLVAALREGSSVSTAYVSVLYTEEYACIMHDSICSTKRVKEKAKTVFLKRT